VAKIQLSPSEDWLVYRKGFVTWLLLWKTQAKDHGDVL